MLKLLCNPDRRGELDRIQFPVLNAGEPHGIIENDAVDENSCWTFLASNVSAICFRYSKCNVVRYLWSNNLIRPFRNLADDHKIVLFATVYVSYLSEKEQNTVYKVIDAMGVKLKRHLELLNLNDEGHVQDLISFLAWGAEGQPEEI